MDKLTMTYAHANLKISDYWERGITGKGAKIAIFDDAMGMHDALDLKGGYACGSHETYIGTNEHATHCAGIALGKNLKNGMPVGVAPDAELYSVRMYYRTIDDRVKSFIECIEYAISEKIDIVSMSVHLAERAYKGLNATGSSMGVPKHLRIKLRDAFIQAYKNDVLIVVAAGNNNPGDGKDNIEFMEWLPKAPNVITVANLTPSNDRRSSSGVGNWVDVAAYGTFIKATLPGGGYGTKTGTSMATPFIAGLLALYKELFPDLSNNEIKNKLLSNCKRLPNLTKEQQGKGVPMPPKELYDYPTIFDKGQLRRYHDYTWQSIELYAKQNKKWIKTEAMGFV